MLFKKNHTENTQACRCPKCGERYNAAYKFCPMCAYPNGKRKKPERKYDGYPPDIGDVSELEQEPEVTADNGFDAPDITIAKRAMSPDDEMEKLYE